MRQTARGCLWRWWWSILAVPSSACMRNQADITRSKTAMSILFVWYQAVVSLSHLGPGFIKAGVLLLRYLVCLVFALRVALAP